MALMLNLEHEDPRGSIYKVAMPSGQELLVFFCKAGYLRGGHSHDVHEVILVLSGRLRYHKVTEGQEAILELGPGDVSYNLPGTPHMGEFLEDTWLVEWKINAAVGDWTTTDYEPFRKLVREKMAP